MWQFILVLKMSVSSLVISDEVCLREHLAPARVVFLGSLGRVASSTDWTRKGGSRGVETLDG